MKDKNKISSEELNDFLSEVNKNKKPQSVIVKEKQISKYTYKCPKCNKQLDNRKDTCPYCNYKGYIPMNEKEIKKIRSIMFVIVLAIAIALLLIRKLL